jgi:hypothetical protein
VQDEGLVRRRLDHPREVVLLQRRVDVGVGVVVERAEVPVEAQVHARGLQQRLVVRVERDASGGDLGADVAVGEQHPRTLSAQSDTPTGRAGAVHRP